MPLSTINKILKFSKKASREELESEWKSAETMVKKQYDKSDPMYFGTLMKIFKNKIKKHYGIN